MMVVYGAEGAASTVVTALTGALTTTASQCQDAIAAVLPVALPVMGAIVVEGNRQIARSRNGSISPRNKRGLPTGSGRSLFFHR